MFRLICYVQPLAARHATEIFVDGSRRRMATLGAPQPLAVKVSSEKCKAKVMVKRHFATFCDIYDVIRSVYAMSHSCENCRRSNCSLLSSNLLYVSIFK